LGSRRKGRQASGPAPEPAAGQVRIAVHACGVNFADTLIIGGKYQERPKHPFSPGLEVSGEVVSSGPGVSGFAPLIIPKSTAKARRAVSADEELTLGWRPAPGLEIPRRPKWFLAEKLGEGGFGEVWLAHHGKTHEARVFKFCYRADRLRSLQREVTLFRLLKETLGSRSDIARILDWNFEKAPYFLESEYTEGGNLLEWTAERGGALAVPQTQRLELIAQIAEALSAAHSVGILHKDVKPSNVLITNGTSGNPQVRLTDFGIGVVTDRGVLAERGITLFELTEMVANGTSSAGGTHLYMAPELVEGRTPTVQADIYALGVMLYQFLVGDFSRALASGWRRDLDDEILIEDIASMVDGHPDRRLRDAREVAERLRTLAERRAQQEAERREREEREAERRALERAQRRRKISLLVAGVATVVLLLVSVLAYQALEARNEAESRRAQAEGLIGFMVGDLREKLEPIGRLDILDEVGDQALAYFDAVPADDLTDDEVFRRSQALYQIGDVRVSQGDLGAAMVAYQESLELVEPLASRDPSNPTWQNALGMSYFGIGWVHWRRRDLDAAERSFRDYLKVAENLAAQEPDNPEWQRELAYTRSNIASILEARGDLDGAREELKRSLLIRQQLVATEPANEQRLLDLAVGHNKLGAILEASGRLSEALTEYRQDLKIVQRLVAEAPEDRRLTERLATSHTFVGFVSEALGDVDGALTHHRLALQEMSALVRSDPANLRWRRNLATVHLRLGATLLMAGQPRDAGSDYRHAVRIFRELTSEDDSNATWRLELAGAHVSLGETLLRSGAWSEVEEHIDAALEILHEQQALNPDDRQILRYLSNCLTLKGRWLSATGEPEAANEAWESAAATIASVAASSSDRLFLTAWATPLLLLDRTQEAEPIVRRLEEMGYRDPLFWSLCQKRGIGVGL